MQATHARGKWLGARFLAQAGFVFLVTAGSVAGGLLPVPAEEAQREAMEVVREVYGEVLAKAGTPAEKAKLANRLLDESNKAVEPANRYALLFEARQLAVEAGDLQTALAAIEQMTGIFDVDPVRIQASTLWQLSAITKDKEVHAAIAMQAQKLVDASVQQGQFDLAEKLVDFAVENARSARDGKLVHAIVAHGETIVPLREQYDEVQRALAVLETKPLDPAANRAAGRWRCFLQDRWDEGLPMLVLGDDAALNDLAKRDLLSPQTAAERLAVADGWWEFAEQCDEQLAARVKRRAGLWYARVLPAITGLDQQRAQVRLKEAGPVVAIVPEGSRPFQGRYYKVIEGSVSWLEAKRQCEQLGGWLCSIGSEDENRFISELLDGRCAWIGGYYDDGWKWVDGEPFSFAPWCPGEPNNRRLGSYICINWANHIGGWNDHDTRTSGISCFVCEFGAHGSALVPEELINAGEPATKPETATDDPASPVAAGRYVLSGPNVVKLTELKPVRSKVGWDGFWVNRAPGESWPLIGPDFQYCREFLYAHAPSRLAYVLPRGMLSFTAVGYCVRSRSVRFLVVADGTAIFESPKAGIAEIRIDLPPRTKVLELVVDDIGDKGSDQSFWCVPRLHKLKIDDLEEKRGASVSMTTLPPAAARVGSGKLWINRMERPDHPIPVLYQGGGRCDEFFYAHAESEAVFDLPEGTDRFMAVGYAMLSQSVMFRVLVDGKLMHESPKAGIVPIDIAIPEGARQLILETDPLGSGFADHAFWCYPRLRLRQ